VKAEGRGLIVDIDPTKQSNEWLLAAAAEIATAAAGRDLELALPSNGEAPSMTTASTGGDVARVAVGERITNQLGTALLAYQTVAETLNGVQEQDDQVQPVTEKKAAEELASWLTDEKIEYVQAAVEANPELHFTLVATPNVAVMHDGIRHLAQSFNTFPEAEPTMYAPFYDKYSQRELAGTDPANGRTIMFSLIPDSADERLQGGSAHLRSILARLQATTPSLKVPSVFEGVNHWYALRAAGQSLVGQKAFRQTVIHHFDLDVKRLGTQTRNPASCVLVGGIPDLSGLTAMDQGYARLALG
jgi:hypothetical protein